MSLTVLVIELYPALQRSGQGHRPPGRRRRPLHRRHRPARRRSREPGARRRRRARHGQGEAQGRPRRTSTSTSTPEANLASVIDEASEAARDILTEQGPRRAGGATAAPAYTTASCACTAVHRGAQPSPNPWLPSLSPPSRTSRKRSKRPPRTRRRPPSRHEQAPAITQQGPPAGRHRKHPLRRR